MNDQKHAPVQRHHRLAVLRAQGYSEEWLLERKDHICNRWLEHGHAILGSIIGNNDKLAQEMADMEAAGRGEAVAYREALHRIVDRLDRLIEQEFGADPKPDPRIVFCKGLVGAINDVFSFHDAAEVSCLDSPQWPGDDRAQLRWNMAVEELGELGAALCPNHATLEHALEKLRSLTVVQLQSELGSKTQIINVADALADKIYIDIGTALEFGIPLDRVWAAVQHANMAKVGLDGKVLRREDGKILKPEGWQPPDVEKAVFGPRNQP